MGNSAQLCALFCFDSGSGSADEHSEVHWAMERDETPGITPPCSVTTIRGRGASGAIKFLFKIMLAFLGKDMLY